MICPICGAKNDEDSKYCGECGAPLIAGPGADSTRAGDGDASTATVPDTQEGICPVCHAKNGPDVIYCMYCGAKIGAGTSWTGGDSGAWTGYGGTGDYEDDAYENDDDDNDTAGSFPRKAMIGILCVILVVVIAAVAVLVVGQMGKKNGGSDTAVIADTDSDDEDTQEDTDDEEETAADVPNGTDSLTDDDTDEEEEADDADADDAEDASEAEDDDEESQDDAEEADDDYILPDSDTRYYTRTELEDLTDYELKLARNEIYARHGRMFDDEELQAYFDSKSWYEPLYTPDEFDEFGDTLFNDYELANRDLIVEIEADR